MRVYKFLREHHALEDIKERRIKVSEFQDMNDPFELKGLTWSDPRVEDLMSSHAVKDGALCFSRNWSNPLLWSHYADKHKGICLGLDIPDRPGLIHRPIYVGAPEMQDSSILSEALRTRNFGTAEDPVMKKLLLKYEDWRYEDEVRVFTHLDGKGDSSRGNRRDTMHRVKKRN